MLLPSVSAQTSVCASQPSRYGVCLLTARRSKRSQARVPASPGQRRSGHRRWANPAPLGSPAKQRPQAAAKSANNGDRRAASGEETSRQSPLEQGDDANAAPDERTSDAPSSCRHRMCGTSEASLTLAGHRSAAPKARRPATRPSPSTRSSRARPATRCCHRCTEADGDFQFAAARLGGNSAFYVRVGEAQKRPHSRQAAPSVTIDSPAAARRCSPAAVRAPRAPARWPPTR